jgi:hypothetical protein
MGSGENVPDVFDLDDDESGETIDDQLRRPEWKGDDLGRYSGERA